MCDFLIQQHMHQLSGSHVLLFDLQLRIVKGPSVIT